MKVIAGYRYLKILVKTNISQIILVEKYGTKYVLKMAIRKDYNHLIEREYIMLKYLFPLGFVPRPIAIGMIGKRFYFIREWMYGVTLGDFLNNKPHEIVTEYFKETLYILYRLHTHGIILRDISPSNFLVTRDGKLYLLDVGLAILYREKGSLEGTPHYLAPESISEQKYSFKTDIYSTGIMFYQLYTKKLPFTIPHIDALLVQQRHGLPIMHHIPSLPKNLISKILAFDPKERPTVLKSIKILNETPRIGQLLLDKSFPMIFSSSIDKIVDTIQKKDVHILNVFHTRYPEGFFSYIFRELELRLQLKGYKTSLNTFTQYADIIIFKFLYNQHEVPPEFLNNINNGKKVIIFSTKPLKIDNLPVNYLNLNMREFILEEWFEEILSMPYKPADTLNFIPLYAKLNLQILEYILPDDFPLNKNILQTLADYLYAEFHDLIDLLSMFSFAVPKDIIHTDLLNARTETYAKLKEKNHTALLLLLELMGFIDITKNHIILLPAFNLLLRREKMRRLTEYSPTAKNIYDELEYILKKAHFSEDLPSKIKDLLHKNRIPPTHARIFLDILYESIPNPEIKFKLLETKISLGFWKSSLEDWQKLSMEIPEKYPALLFDFIRLSISLGKYREAVSMLEGMGNNPQAVSLLIYAHALFSNFDELEKTIKKKQPDTENPYYHIALGLFELIKNKNITLGKNHAVRASELSLKNPHATMVATYLYGISILESGNTDAAINILESITGREEYGIEALLVNFQLGYIHYRRNEFLKAIYYFEYSYYMARELHNNTLSTQAAFYLSHIYYQNDRLDLAESYMDHVYKYRVLLSKGQKRYLERTYVKLAVDTHHYQKAIEFLEKNPDVEQLSDLMTLARLYQATGKIEKLKSLKKRAKTKEEKELINAFLIMLDKNKKNKEVHHD